MFRDGDLVVAPILVAREMEDGRRMRDVVQRVTTLGLYKGVQSYTRTSGPRRGETVNYVTIVNLLPHQPHARAEEREFVAGKDCGSTTDPDYGSTTEQNNCIRMATPLDVSTLNALHSQNLLGDNPKRTVTYDIYNKLMGVPVVAPVTVSSEPGMAQVVPAMPGDSRVRVVTAQQVPTEASAPLPGVYDHERLRPAASGGGKIKRKRSKKKRRKSTRRLNHIF